MRKDRILHGDSALLFPSGASAVPSVPPRWPFCRKNTGKFFPARRNTEGNDANLCCPFFRCCFLLRPRLIMPFLKISSNHYAWAGKFFNGLLAVLRLAEILAVGLPHPCFLQQHQTGHQPLHPAAVRIKNATYGIGPSGKGCQFLKINANPRQGRPGHLCMRAAQSMGQHRAGVFITAKKLFAGTGGISVRNQAKFNSSRILHLGADLMHPAGNGLALLGVKQQLHGCIDLEEQNPGATACQKPELGRLQSMGRTAGRQAITGAGLVWAAELRQFLPDNQVACGHKAGRVCAAIERKPDKPF